MEFTGGQGSEHCRQTIWLGEAGQGQARGLLGNLLAEAPHANFVLNAAMAKIWFPLEGR
jgi:hypothetical protein